MKKTNFRILGMLLVVCSLSVAGYLVKKLGEPPSVATWSVEESNANRDYPTDRTIERQIRALAERDPVNDSAMNFQHEAPWHYGVRGKNGWAVPETFAEGELPVTSLSYLPVRIISWTGEAAKGERYKELDRAAVAYAEKYNRQTNLNCLNKWANEAAAVSQLNSSGRGLRPKMLLADAQPAGAGQPATKPAVNVPAKDQPLPHTSEDAPR